MNKPISLPRKAKGQRPQYFSDPAIEQALSITLALAGEVSVLRDRLDTVERILGSKNIVSREEIESYVPDATVRGERAAWREIYLSTVLRVVHQEREDLELRANQGPYEEVIKSVEEQ